jgi:hypothetical protein
MIARNDEATMPVHKGRTSLAARTVYPDMCAVKQKPKVLDTERRAAAMVIMGATIVFFVALAITLAFPPTQLTIACLP